MSALSTPATSIEPAKAAQAAEARPATQRRAEPRCGPLRLWWDLIAGPGPRWLRLLRWAQRNCRD